MILDRGLCLTWNINSPRFHYIDLAFILLEHSHPWWKCLMLSLYREHRCVAVRSQDLEMEVISASSLEMLMEIAIRPASFKRRDISLGAEERHLMALSRFLSSNLIKYFFALKWTKGDFMVLYHSTNHCTSLHITLLKSCYLRHHHFFQNTEIMPYKVSPETHKMILWRKHS